MKKFLLLIGVITTTFLISCSNNEVNSNNKEFVESIVSTINNTYKNELDSLKKNNENATLVLDEKLKSELEEYYIDEENRLEYYNGFKETNKEKFEEILNKVDETIYPRIKSFIEDFKIKFNNETEEEYNSIKSKLNQ